MSDSGRLSGDRSAKAAILTVGHSNHEAEVFVELVQRHGVEVLVDVRSVPRSGYSPQFDRRTLEKLLEEQGVQYFFLGDVLGGRPSGDEYYDADSHVRYDLVAESAPFLGGLDRLIDGSTRFRVALMCSEEDPTGCHRRLLIGRVLEERGIPLKHIRKDGEIQTDEDLEPMKPFQVQTDLFGQETTTWRSIRPVSQGGQRGTSSND